MGLALKVKIVLNAWYGNTKEKNLRLRFSG